MTGRPIQSFGSSPVHPVTNVGPLVVVLTVSLMKQAFEDWIWFLSDNVINSSLVAALHYGDWVEIPWSKLMVGDIVKVHVTDADDYQQQTEMMAVLDGSAEISAEEERQLEFWLLNGTDCWFVSLLESGIEANRHSSHTTAF
ncbi:unnamed protein product [Sphagnum tenellum]